MVTIPALDFDPTLIFECGQCFRFDRQPDEAYSGVAFGRQLTVRRNGDTVTLDCDEDEYDRIWRGYFDMDTDYAAIRQRISADAFTAQCAECGTGIRILKQDFWEALCSFIISPCNNITRIKGIIAKLCELYGEPLDTSGGDQTLRAFPTAERIAELDVADLAPLRSGYRAKNILSAARAVASGSIDPEYIRSLDTEAAIAELCRLEGVGRKVASCVLLFGVGKRDAFPVDVWMKRALERHYPVGFDGSSFGNDAGIAQQYIFHYVRTFECRSGV